jgi:chemotaxis protein MotB
VRIKRQRRRVQHEHSNHERWLVSYADFITLLFAFFVVLYSSAQMDNKKVVRVAAAIKGAFQELGVFTGTGSNIDSPKNIIVIPAPEGSGAPRAFLATVPPSSTVSTAGSGAEASDVSPSTVSKGNNVDTEALKRQLEEALADEIRKQKVQMRVGPDGLVVSLREVGFFGSGEAKLLSQAAPTITHLAKVLEQKDFEIRVEGHTDNVPIHSARFDSNWELSTARATEVVTMLVRDYGFDPHDVSVAGYAEFRPIASNDTEEGRRANRRIDLVVVGLKKPSPSPAQIPGAQKK